MPIEKEKLEKLEELKKETTLKSLDLRNFQLTGDYAGIVKEIISANKDLEMVLLANNDLREEMKGIFEALKSLPKLTYLDIVDNNIESEDTWGVLASLIESKSSLVNIYIGARRIMGSSNGRHTVFILNSTEKQYHNACWVREFYGTGYNEVVMGDMGKIAKAMAARGRSGYPVQVIYMLSNLRTTTQVIKIKEGEYSFYKHKGEYSPEIYVGDGSQKEIIDLQKEDGPLSFKPIVGDFSSEGRVRTYSWGPSKSGFFSFSVVKDCERQRSSSSGPGELPAIKRP